jgi:hypothetical protein
MAAAIRENRQPQTHGREGRKSLALVLAMYESARTGAPVTIADGIWETSGGSLPGPRQG